VAESWTRLTALAKTPRWLLCLFRGKMTDDESDALLIDKVGRGRSRKPGAGQTDAAVSLASALISWAPGLLYNGMIAPLTPFPIRGVIWYQGESNSALEGRRFTTACSAR